MKKKRNYYNLIFYGLIVSYFLLFVFIIIFLGIMFIIKELPLEWQPFVIAILSFLIFLTFLFTDLANKYQRKFTIKIIKKCKKPIVLAIDILDNKSFQKNFEVLGYQLWNDIELDVPIYIRRIQKRLFGIVDNKVMVFILYEDFDLNKELLNKIKENRKKVVSKLRSEKLKNPFFQLGIIVNLEKSNNILQSYIDKTVPQLMDTSILECFIVRDEHKVYLPRIFFDEFNCKGLKKEIEKILQIKK